MYRILWASGRTWALTQGGGNCRGLWAEEGHAGMRVLTRALWWPWWGEQTAEQSRSQGQGQEGDGGAGGKKWWNSRYV